MFGPYEMLMDFGLMSVILLISHLIRSKLKIFSTFICHLHLLQVLSHFSVAGSF